MGSVILLGLTAFADRLTLQRHFVLLKIECRKDGKHALESPPNRVDHESVAVVLS